MNLKSLKKLLEKFILVMVIICMTCVNLIFLINNVAIAIYDEIELQTDSTTESNVKFDAYFKNGDEKQRYKELDILSTEEILYIEVNVKDKIFIENAKLKFTEMNFKINEQKLEDNKYIQNVDLESNEIELTSISSNSDVIIEIPIVFNKKEQINEEYFSKEANITLQGNVQNNSQEQRAFSGEKIIKPIWIANPEVELNQEIEKYFSLEEGGFILQQKISTNVENNILPRRSEKIIVEIPVILNTNIENIRVLFNGSVIEAEKINIDQNNNILEINGVKSDGDFSSWGNDKNDYTIIYKYSNPLDEIEKNVYLKTKLELELYTEQDTIEKVNEGQFEFDTKGNVVTVNSNLQGDLYKGYMYNNVDKNIEFLEINEVEISYVKNISKIVLDTNDIKFKNVDGEKFDGNGKIKYLATKISKEEVLAVLGDTGYIEIKDLATGATATINKDTEVDDNGYIVIQYNENSDIQIIINNPQNEGKINIINKKAILGEVGYSFNEIKKFNKVVLSSIIKTEVSEQSSYSEVDLKESVTEAALEINKTSLTNLEVNEDVQFKVTLKSNYASQDLYKNPVIEIYMPEGVNEINLKSINILYGDEFQLSSMVEEKNNRLVIKIELTGEQIEYREKVVDGIVVTIDADLTLDNNVTSKVDTFQMIYTNEKANTYINDKVYGELNYNVNIVSPIEQSDEYDGSVIANRQEISATIIESDTEVGPELEVELNAKIGSREVLSDSDIKNGETITYIAVVKNVGTEDVTNINLKGKIPEGTELLNLQNNEAIEEAYSSRNNNEFTIDLLKSGESITKIYEVKVKNDTLEESFIQNKCTIEYGEVQKESNIFKNKVVKGDFSIIVNRIFADNRVYLSKNDLVIYKINIDNISNDVQENVKLNINIPEQAAEIEKLTVSTNKEESGYNGNEFEYIDNLDIGNLGVNETFYIYCYVRIKQVEENQEMAFSLNTIVDNSIQRSNEIIYNIKGLNIKANMTVDKEEALKTGDIITYTIKIANNSELDANTINIQNDVPSELNLKRIIIDGVEETFKDIEGNEINIEAKRDIMLIKSLKANSEMEIKIVCVVKENLSRTETVEIENSVKIVGFGEEIITNKIVHRILADSNGEFGPNGDGTCIISGIAWNDKNKNGKKDNNEELLKDINVKVLNIKTNKYEVNPEGTEIIDNTDDLGFYELKNIPKGEYLVVFEYDSVRYRVTNYKADKVEDSKNSKVISKSLDLGDGLKVYGVTDVLVLDSFYMDNINIGLVELGNFDLKLDKHIKRVVLQNNKGTLVKEYDNVKLAKLEIKPKEINGTMIIIEYEIVIKNVGEIEGYAKKIVDYIPSDLKFNSELNKDWYQAGKVLYSTSIENQKLLSGESKTLKLVLTKVMTENNTGTITNMAEIAEDYNQLEIADSNSTPNNKNIDENDLGKADIIISFTTGESIAMIVSIIIIAMLIISLSIKKIVHIAEKGGKNRWHL